MAVRQFTTHSSAIHSEFSIHEKCMETDRCVTPSFPSVHSDKHADKHTQAHTPRRTPTQHHVLYRSSYIKILLGSLFCSGPSKGWGVRWVRLHPLSLKLKHFFFLACYRGWWCTCTKIPLPRVLENWPKICKKEKKCRSPPPPPPPPPLISFFRTCVTFKAGGAPVKKNTAYGPGAKSAPPPLLKKLLTGLLLIVDNLLTAVPKVSLARAYGEYPKSNCI